MKILFIASESTPFIKSGGLADVIGSLPKELVKQGIDIRVVLPKYSLIAGSFQENMEFCFDFLVRVGWREQYCGVYEMKYNGVIYYFIDNEYYFKREQLYGYSTNYDEVERYSFFSRAALEMLPTIDFQPDVIHSHDWHTAAVPYLLKSQFYKKPFYSQIKSVFTIHNLKYQGIFPPEALYDLLHGKVEDFTIDGFEFYGNVNYLKAGIVYSDAITTVSPTYAKEVQSPYYGERLDGLLRSQSNKLHGILNGIDEEIYDPQTDSSIFINYNKSLPERKLENKDFLQKHVGLPQSPNVPLISMVTRLVDQKGIDLVLCVLEQLLSQDVQLMILGSGDAHYEDILLQASRRYPHKLKFNVEFNEDLAHQIYAASDMFLMPSLFEPCGLSQLIALRYGAIPIVRETGGLYDTVQPFNEVEMEGNGFTFTNYNAHDMLYTIQRAITFYHHKDVWEFLIQEGMSRDYSWRQSARKYCDIYASLLKQGVPSTVGPINS